MSTTAAAHPTVPATTQDSRRWWVLAAVTTAQLMIGLDLTIMNIALPSVQRSLDLSDPSRQWVVTIFALGYGGLLLLGGRLSDLMGRRRSLIIGLTGFAVASALGGAATGPAMLLTARGLQGAFGALLTPSILAALAAAFPLPTERGKAFGIYAAAIGSSSGLGVVLGGVLTSFLDWRWCMFVNLPIAVAAAAGVLYAVRPMPRTSGVRVDITGALLATAGLMALVYGFARAESNGWGGRSTVGTLTAGALALAAFALVQTRAKGPLLPPRVVLDRRRAGSYLAVLCLAVGMFAALFFLTFYLQNVLGYSPIRAGLAFLPVTAGLMAGIRVVSPLLMRAPVRALLCPGLLAMAAGLLLLGFVRVESGATVMTSQQIGASLGTALLSTIAGTAAASYLRTHPAAADAATVHGLNVASLGAAGFLCAAAALVFLVAGPQTARAAR